MSHDFPCFRFACVAIVSAPVTRSHHTFWFLALLLPAVACVTLLFFVLEKPSVHVSIVIERRDGERPVPWSRARKFELHEIDPDTATLLLSSCALTWLNLLHNLILQGRSAHPERGS